MRQLRFGMALALMGALSGFGCDDESTAADAGGADTGVTLMDSGSGTDSGPSTGDDGGAETDGGPSTGMCGNPGECDVLAQNCGAGMACRNLVPVDGEAPTGLCEPAGTKLEGEPCSRETAPECAEGLICSGGFCREYCCEGRASDCSVLGHYCQEFTGTTVGLCFPNAACGLLDQSGCEAGQGCYPLEDGITRCANPVADASDPGGSCNSLDSCNPGSACIGDPGVCRAFCDPTATDPCPTDLTCAGLGGHEGVGVCIPASG